MLRKKHSYTLLALEMLLYLKTMISFNPIRLVNISLGRSIRVCCLAVIHTIWLQIAHCGRQVARIGIIMLKRLLIAGMMTFVAPAGFAQESNLAALKCADFLALSPQNSLNVMMWLMGYFTYEDDPTVIDMAQEKIKETQLRQYCSDHKDFSMMDAADIFMDKKYKG